jgi:hypothetical protein
MRKARGADAQRLQRVLAKFQEFYNRGALTMEIGLSRIDLRYLQAKGFLKSRYREFSNGQKVREWFVPTWKPYIFIVWNWIKLVRWVKRTLGIK